MKKWISLSIIVLLGLLMVIVLYRGGASLTSYISDNNNKDFIDSSGNYDCSENVYNCADFKYQEDAQRVFELCGGIDLDVHFLDGDDDGKACESLDNEPESSSGIGGFGFY